jgi:hypothetical protein
MRANWETRSLSQFSAYRIPQRVDRPSLRLVVRLILLNASNFPTLSALLGAVVRLISQHLRSRSRGGARQ